jgi:RND family efflux transporter MFP subunit
MKTEKLLSVMCLAILIGCGEKTNELEQKKETLKQLKQQMGELKTQISALENEIDLADTTFDGGVVVKTQELVSTNFTHFITQPGLVSSKENVLVSVEMGGMVVNRLVEEGRWVNKGDAIIQLDASVMSNQVEDLRQSSELAKTTYERQDNLWKQAIGSEMQYLQAKNQYVSLQKKLAAMEAQLDKLELVAPISGRLDEIFINVGEFAAPAMPAFRIVNSKKLQIEVDVAERYSAIIKKGDKVNVEFNALGIESQHKVTFVGQVINPQNRTFKVKINLNNTSGDIKPNAVASVQLQDFNQEDAMVLPSSCIKKDMRGSFVFVAEGNKAIKKYVEIGLSQDDKTHILSGLGFGQDVIVIGYDGVANGSTIDIKN